MILNAHQKNFEYAIDFIKVDPFVNKMKMTPRIKETKRQPATL